MKVNVDRFTHNLHGQTGHGGKVPLKFIIILSPEGCKNYQNKVQMYKIWVQKKSK